MCIITNKYTKHNGRHRNNTTYSALLNPHPILYFNQPILTPTQAHPYGIYSSAASKNRQIIIDSSKHQIIPHRNIIDHRAPPCYDQLQTIRYSEYSNSSTDFPLILDNKAATVQKNGRNHSMRKRTVSSATKDIISNMNKTLLGFTLPKNDSAKGKSIDRSFISTRTETRGSSILRHNFDCKKNPKFKKMQSAFVNRLKYKVVVGHFESNQSYFNDDAIKELQYSHYQSRYIVYVNNHNILNDMKQFLISHGRELSKEQTEKILKLIDEYETIISNEEKPLL